MIKSFDNNLNFEKGNEEFRFMIHINKSNYFSKVFVINGFKVTGAVEADQEPLENVLILIYAFDKVLVKNYHCEGLSINLKEYEFNNNLPICVLRYFLKHSQSLG